MTPTNPEQLISQTHIKNNVSVQENKDKRRSRQTAEPVHKLNLKGKVSSIRTFSGKQTRGRYLEKIKKQRGQTYYHRKTQQ